MREGECIPGLCELLTGADLQSAIATEVSEATDIFRSATLRGIPQDPSASITSPRISTLRRKCADVLGDRPYTLSSIWDDDNEDIAEQIAKIPLISTMETIRRNPLKSAPGSLRRSKRTSPLQSIPEVNVGDLDKENNGSAVQYTQVSSTKTVSGNPHILVQSTATSSRPRPLQLVVNLAVKIPNVEYVGEVKSIWDADDDEFTH